MISVYLYFLIWSNMTSYWIKSYLGPSNSYYIVSYLGFLFFIFYLASRLIQTAKKNLHKKVLYIYYLSFIIDLAFINIDDQISTPLLKIQRYDNYIMLFNSLYISYTTIKVQQDFIKTTLLFKNLITFSKKISFLKNFFCH